MRVSGGGELKASGRRVSEEAKGDYKRHHIGWIERVNRGEGWIRREIVASVSQDRQQDVSRCVQKGERKSFLSQRKVRRNYVERIGENVV